MLNLLTQEDKSKIQSKISTYLSTKDIIHPKATLNHFLRLWAKNKSPLLKYTDNSLTKIIKFDIERDVSLSIERLLLNTYSELYLNFIKLDPNFTQFFSVDSLSTNIYKGKTFYHTLPNGSLIKIQQGCRVIKTFAKIAEAHNLPFYRTFIEDHSLVLNDKKIKGYLHLSIHPYDILSMSDTTFSWKTCYSWKCNGDSKQATVELMNSPNVLVAFFTPDGNPDKKIWRQYFYISGKGIFPSKAYPYSFDEATVKILRELDPKAEVGTIVPSSRIKLNAQMVYNDWANYYTAMPCILYKDIPIYTLSFPTDTTECVSCGNTHIPNASRLLCRDCDPKEFCANCGFYFHYSKVTEVDNNFYICDSCYEEEYSFCEGCHSSQRNEQMETINVTDSKGKGIGSFELCETCAGLNVYYSTTDALPCWKGYIVKKSKLTPAGLNILNLF